MVISVLLSGWLALLLAEFGIFSLWLHLALLLVICGALLAVRKVYPTPPPALHSPSAGWVPLAFAAIALLALLLVLPPFQTILGARDAGVYANTGFAIARTGG
ncbi:MAG: hypothetical protein HC893_12695, partial [Chloroflexaceae bacterium]|nr:hypothetical protein [Chloroflexaceae bacterium]